VLGKPYTSSEWQYSWPNEYRLEGVPLVAAHAALQCWDAALQFDYSGGDWARTIESNFDSGNKPDVWAQWPAMALMFHRQDLAPDPLPEVAATGPEPEADREAVGGRLPAGIETRKAVRNWIGPTPPSLPLRPGAADGPTGSLKRTPGMLLIETPRTVAIVGFLSAAPRVVAGPVTLDSPTEFGSVIVSSLTDDPLTRSRRLLITTVGRAENSGLVYGPTRDTVLNPGRAPILMDPVRGTLRLAREDPVDLRVYRIDCVGRRASEVPVSRVNNSIVIPLQSEALTLWYELSAP